MTVLTRSTETTVAAPARPSERTRAGVALQATWVGFLVYATAMAAAQPTHPQPPGWLQPVLDVMSFAILAATAGLLFRRRWALWASAALALPMVGAAVFCILADAGAHWVAEVGFATAVVGLSVHPGSWRMHSR